MNLQSAAIQLATLGYHVHPLRPHNKPPATENGHLDASCEPQTVAATWKRNPHANIGIALQPSGLIVIGPDCQAWLDEFQRRGTPDTLISETASGPGHRHYYYRRPPGVPIHRLCVSGQYDLMTNGYVIAPPSATTAPPAKVTGVYRWLSPLRPVSELPEPPAWAIEMLQEHADKEAAKPAPAPLPTEPLRASDQEVIRLIRASKSGAKFDRLFAGDVEAHDGIDRSHSGADMALLSLITFWTQDENQLDRIFAQSALYRPDKWKGSYRTATLMKALARSDFYQPMQRGLRLSRRTVRRVDARGKAVRRAS
jgi:hypothetical protein